VVGKVPAPGCQFTVKFFHEVPTVKHSTKLWTAALVLSAIPTVLLAARLDNVVPSGPSSSDQPSGSSSPNQLSDAEKKAGWKLLFDGKSFDGWHNFKKDGVQPGWQVKDGAMVCVDPHNAGDLVTTDKYDWFELSLEYNISEGGNSGIMFHVTNAGGAIWATGPEIQLEDNVKAKDPERCGWMYQLYKPAIDPKTGKPLDATKPVGEWNHIRLVIAPAPARSEVDLNGVKYYDFVYNSDDFKARVAKSKFRRMRDFAKSDSGFIGLQGDHGSISFRNVKLRVTTPLRS
jgi:hypothetical protein